MPLMVADNGVCISGEILAWREIPMKLMNLWNGLRGKPITVQLPGRPPMDLLNVWQYLKLLRGKPFIIQNTDDDGPMPDLDTVRRSVEANPTDAQARTMLAAYLMDAGSLDEAYRECLEAIAVLSNAPNAGDDYQGRSQRAHARGLAAQVLEQMGRNADARQYWQGCADDLRSVVPQEILPRHLYYVQAMRKLR